MLWRPVWEQTVSIEWSDSLVGKPSADHLPGVLEGTPTLRTCTTGTATPPMSRQRPSRRPGVQARTVTGLDDIEARKADWLISLPTGVTETRIEPGGARTDRHTAMHHDSLGRLDTTLVEKDSQDPGTVRLSMPGRPLNSCATTSRRAGWTRCSGSRQLDFGVISSATGRGCRHRRVGSG